MLIGIFQLKEIHFSVTIKGRGWTVVAKKTPSVVSETYCYNDKCE